MRRRRRLVTRFVPLCLAALAALVWQFGPFQSVQAIASLSDPTKLRTLGERGANARLNKIVYWLDQARQSRLSAETAIEWAQTWNGVRGEHASFVKASLLRNLKIADELGLLTRENQRTLRLGRAAIVTRGPYAGETAEIDHIVPYSLAPEAGNELANLEMLPKSLNRQKSDRVEDRQLAHAEKLFEAKLLTKESLVRVKAASK